MVTREALQDAADAYRARHRDANDARRRVLAKREEDLGVALKSLVESGVPKSRVAEMAGVSRPTLYRLLEIADGGAR